MSISNKGFMFCYISPAISISDTYNILYTNLTSTIPISTIAMTAITITATTEPAIAPAATTTELKQ